MVTKKQIKQAEDQFVQVPYERSIVEVVDQLIKLARKAGYSGTVETDKQWQVMEFLVKMWADLYPDEYQSFTKEQKFQKTHQKTKYASNREGQAEIRHLVEIPITLYRLIKAIFPNQTFDKKFSIKLGNKIPMLRWSEKI